MPPPVSGDLPALHLSMCRLPSTRAACYTPRARTLLLSYWSLHCIPRCGSKRLHESTSHTLHQYPGTRIAPTPDRSSAICAQGACLQVGQMDLANASLAAAAAGGALSPSMLAAQGKLALVPPEMPASGPSMAQRRLMIEQVGYRPGNVSSLQQNSSKACQLGWLNSQTQLGGRADYESCLLCAVAPCWRARHQRRPEHRGDDGD